MGFVDDDRVVAEQVRIASGFGQQDAVGHHLDGGAVVDGVAVPNGVPDS